MKKLYLSMLGVLCTVLTFAQVPYSFRTTMGTYTPITGGTVIGAATNALPTATPETATLDDNTFAAVALPFTFTFNSVAYNAININTNGWVSFGATSTSTSSPINSTNTYGGVISAFSTDLMGIYAATGTRTVGSNIITAVSNTSKAAIGAAIQGAGIPAGSTITAFDATSITISANATAASTGTFVSWTTGEIRTETLGSAPNRIFVIQFKGMSEYSNSVGTENNTTINFQIRLAEAGGVAADQTVEAIYGEVSRAAGSEVVQVGLRGATNTEYSNRTSTTDWAATAPGTSNTATVTWTPTVFPATGLTYTWKPSAAVIDYANLQFPASGTVPYGTNLSVYTQGYEPGLTEAPGAGANIAVWIGVSTTNTNPNTWTTWIPATFNVQVGNNDEFMAGIGSTLNAGTYYYASRWQIDGGLYRYGGYPNGFWDGTSQVSGVLTVTPPPPPSNDDCAAATALTPAADLTCAVQTAGTTVSATQSTETAPTCGATGVNDDVWYKFVATSASHIVTLSTVSGSTDMAMAAYSGSCGSLTQLICSDPNQMTVSGLTAGQTYYVRVWTFTSTTTTTATFNICITTPPPPPANDVCSGATALPVNATCVPQTFNMLGATDNNETGDCTQGTEAAIWFKFVATETNATITVDGAPGMDAVLGVLTACGSATSPTGGTCIDNTGDDGVETRTLTGLTIGNTYLIQVYDYQGDVTAATTFDICVVSVGCPAPTGVTAGTITGSGSSITWTGTGTFILEYGPTGFTPGTGATAGAGGTVINPATSPQAISGLAFNTGYDVYVRQDCSGTGAGFSANSSVTTFTTLPAPPANDNCSGATVIGSTPTNGSTLSATQSQAAEICGTFTSNAANDVWFQFTALSDGAATITVAGVVGMDVVIQGYSGTCAALANIGCADATASGSEVMVLNGLVAGQTYYLRVYGYNGGRGTFNVTVTGAAVPVTIEYFKGSKQTNGNLLDWKVACYNSPTVTLVLERGEDSRKFSPVSSSTETSLRCLQPFSYTDVSPVPGINYYRLKTIDADGKVSYSSIVALINKETGFEIVSLMPNPVKTTAILSVSSARKGNMQVLISDLAGRQLSKYSVSLIAGSNQVPLKLSSLAAGTYQVTGLMTDGTRTTLKFVKE